MAVRGNGIEIRTGREETEIRRAQICRGEVRPAEGSRRMEEARRAETRRPLGALLFLMAGVLGLVIFSHSLRGISFPAGVICPVAAGLCWLFWYTYYGKKRYFLLCSFLLAAVCWAAVLLMGETLREQLRVIAACLAGKGGEETVEVTEAALLLSALAVFFAALAEFFLKSHEVLYLLTMMLILLSPLLGIRGGIAAVFLLALFQTAFQVVQTVRAPGGRTMLEGAAGRRLPERSGVAAALALAAAFLIALPGAVLCLERLYACTYDAEGRVCRALLRASGRAADPVAGGRISRGNNYPTGTAQLEVVVSAQIKNPLYLKGFCGGEYVGGGWIGSDDEALLGDIMEEMKWQDWEETMDIRFDNMYFLLTRNLLREPSPQPFSVSIRHFGGAFDNVYVPYYSARSRRYFYDEWDDFWYDYGFGNTREGYVYQCYEQQDVRIDWEDYRTNFAADRDWFQAMQDTYMEEIQTAYTAVPVKTLPRLTSLCRENPLGSLDEITAFIISTLHSRAEYTLTPGWAPLNEDVTEYFLFEGGRGYCVHFASAAALMYRLYGVPARYAAGYMLSPASFTEQEDGRWKADATDEDAHAWVEIFLKDYGWTPVEVTPSRDGSIPVSYPGLDREVLSRILEEHGWDQESVGTAGREAGDEDSLRKDPSWKEGFLAELAWLQWEGWRKWQPVAGTCAVYSLCLLPFFLDYRRLRKLRKLEEGGCRKVFTGILGMLESAGILKGYDGTEEDFARALGRAVSLPEEDMARLQEIVSRAAYGGEAAEPEEEAYVWRMYGRLAEALRGKMKWHRRLIFRYWKGF